MVLWPRLTSHDKSFPTVFHTLFPHVRETSRGKINNFHSIHPHHLHSNVRVVLDFVLFGKLIPLEMPNDVRVPRVRNLLSASFRFHLTMDTLVIGCAFPTIRARYGLSPIRLYPCWANHEKKLPSFDDSSFVYRLISSHSLI